jgi:hypothetical protein
MPKAKAKPKTTRKKKTEAPAPETPETSEETVEEPVEETETTVPEEGREEESAAKKAFRALIERYKEQNPAKYAQKEPELLVKLKEL